MKKVFIACTLFTLVFFLFAPLGQASEAQTVAPAEAGREQMDQGTVGAPLDEQMTTLDMREVEKFINQLEREFGGYLPQVDFQQIIKDVAKGKVNLNIVDIMNGLLKYLFRELVANSKLLGQLILLAVIGAVLQNLQSAFEKGTTGKVAYAVVFLSIMILAIQSFGLAVNIGREAVDDMVNFMQILLPILLTLLSALGGFASAAIFHPVMVLTLGVIGTLVKNVVFPLIFFSAVLNILSNISTSFNVSKLAGLFKDVGVVLMGLLMTIFVGVMSIQGVAGSVADSVALRTAKFAAGAFIPVVGKMFTDSLEAVVSSSLLLKNAVGLVALIVIFVLCAFPALKVLSIIFIYRISAAVIQPVAHGQITSCLESMGKSLTIIFVAVAIVGLMFFFAITIMVGAGNLTVMLR